MSSHAWVQATDETRLVFALLGLFGGWAVTEHTDGTVQASAHLHVTPCPECEQDRAFAKATLVATPGGAP